MTTDRDKCSLSSFLPLSCRGRAEAFAKRLQSKLNSLGSNGSNGVVDENTWLNMAQSTSVTLSQPHGTSSVDAEFYDVDSVDSPGSPLEEPDDGDLRQLIGLVQEDAQLQESSSESEGVHTLSLKSPISSCDSDSSDGPFFDTADSELELRPNAPTTNGSSEYSDVFSNHTSDTECQESSQELTTSPSEDSFFTSSSSSSKDSSTLSESVSTLSLETDDRAHKRYTNLIDNTSDVECSRNGHGPNGDTYHSAFRVDGGLPVEYEFGKSGQLHTQTVKIKIDRPEGDGESKTEGEDEDDDDVDGDSGQRSPRVRRCSSLKTGKTPPGTPGGKKIVRFADAMGLDLADVRVYLDDVPQVPSSAFRNLTRQSPCGSSGDLSRTCVSKIVIPLFKQPGGEPDFLERVRCHLVCLENAIVEDAVSCAISGTVRVRNLDFHKTVYVRYSLDQWKTQVDMKAVYVEDSCDGFSDRFRFLIYAHTLRIGERLEFAVRFHCQGAIYWDNNGGANYCFQCLPGSQNRSRAALVDSADFGASFYYGEELEDPAAELTESACRDEDGEHADEDRDADDDEETSVPARFEQASVREAKSLAATTECLSTPTRSRTEPLPWILIVLLSVAILYLHGAVFILI